MGGDSGDDRLLPWLLRQKVAIPDQVAGYLDCAELEDRIKPIRRRLTVLNAPGGFGKTTLLAECCRRPREDGIPIAWVSVAGCAKTGSPSPGSRWTIRTSPPYSTLECA